MSNSLAQSFLDLVKSRRAVFPKNFSGAPVSREEIELLLEAANWAPTHKMTQPWRFQILQGTAKEAFSAWIGDWYRGNTPVESYSAAKHQKMMENPRLSAAVIVICLQRDPRETVAEWEEQAAVACAVENLWLMATALGLGGYWATPTAIKDYGEFQTLEAGTYCLGFFYLGRPAGLLPEGKRDDIQGKTIWLG